MTIRVLLTEPKRHCEADSKREREKIAEADSDEVERYWVLPRNPTKKEMKDGRKNFDMNPGCSSINKC
jgi:hypothetical protein